jgi:hypothetical protein
MIDVHDHMFPVPCHRCSQGTCSMFHDKDVLFPHVTFSMIAHFQFHDTDVPLPPEQPDQVWLAVAVAPHPRCSLHLVDGGGELFRVCMAGAVTDS